MWTIPIHLDSWTTEVSVTKDFFLNALTKHYCNLWLCLYRVLSTILTRILDCDDFRRGNRSAYSNDIYRLLLRKKINKNTYTFLKSYYASETMTRMPTP